MILLVDTNPKHCINEGGLGAQRAIHAKYAGGCSRPLQPCTGLVCIENREIRLCIHKAARMHCVNWLMHKLIKSLINSFSQTSFYMTIFTGGKLL